MSCRLASGWSAPVFMHLAKGSVGLQIGAEEVDLVLLVMNRGGANKLLQDKVSLGTDASVAAGPVGRSAAAATDAQMNAEMLSYSRSHGLFAGIDLSGGVLRPDTEADAVNWRALGYTTDKLVQACRAILDATAAAFPFTHALIAVGFTNGLDATPDAVATAVVAHARTQHPSWSRRTRTSTT